MAVLLLAATSAVMLTATGPAAAGPTCGTAHVRSDFNGDGVADAAIVDDNTGIRVLYGTRAGLTLATNGTAPKNQLLAGGQADLVSPWDVAVPADFNGDGCADLAVSEPDQTVDGVLGAGQVWVFYGSPTGLTGPPDIISVTNIAGQTPRYGDGFSGALAAGDLNHDGLPDLVIGAERRNDMRGQVFIFPGNRLLKVGTSGGRVFVEGDGIVPGAAEANDHFGTDVAVGDFDNDGRADVAIGDPGENDQAGAVMVVRGSGDANLLTATGAKVWTQDTAGILGSAESGDYFGGALAVGSFRAAGETDLAIAVTNETVDGSGGAGAVNVIYSAGTAGLVAAGNQLWDQNSPGLGTTAQNQAYFGFRLAMGDFDGDTRSDLVISAYAETVDGVASAGAVQILPGSTTGLTATGAKLWSQARPGVPGTPEERDWFGATLAALRVTSATHDDLLIGSLAEALSGSPEHPGMVEFFPGSTPGGLTTTGLQEFDELTPGLVGTPGVGYFGVALG
jgi:hypothetical protein